MAFSAAWRSPSNIALVKYWGKYGLQLPRNPSLSLTLSACHTDMRVEVETEAADPGIAVTYDGHPQPSFEPKIKQFFSHLTTFFPWLEQAAVHIDSVNTFPHGAGIASSASAMSALALSLLDIHGQIKGDRSVLGTGWWQHASEIARLGSGSACRSVFPIAALWGNSPSIPDSRDEYAIPWEDHLAPEFLHYRDTIVVVSTSEKAVSSSAGHALMDDLPYAEARYHQARENLQRLVDTLYAGDIDTFIQVVESEALQLHALMMSGKSPYMLMEPETLRIIKQVWAFRKDADIPICFTLDAGPNVHLLYPDAYHNQVIDWINTGLIRPAQDLFYIEDSIGRGPVKTI